MAASDIIIKESHRGLWYEDGVLTKVLTAGRYELPREGWLIRKPQVEVKLVEMRSRDTTIKGQEILTADKVAIRVSILVQFAVLDPKTALHAVENYEDRLYSDVQLAARRSLASMSLEEILTNRYKLSEDILRDVKEAAAGYGVSIARADVKDLTFPGNLQEIMNKVLAAERTSQAQLVEARTRAEVQRIEAETKAHAARLQTEIDAASIRAKAQAEADAIQMKVKAEQVALAERTKTANAYQEFPALLRLEELAAMSDLARNGNARIYLDLQKKVGEE
ncbi:MAG TPA: SPFH domain-containing protein [Gemmatales bacterium]|nr:SPFH domain-containing protein [Gemmatales bacterium]